jgi:triose/dihydroxyacetone kinase / FAD-AMP lyase (cyclizing)
LLQYPNHLAKLEHHNVVMIREPSIKQLVHLICGGGSGHEPSHAGFIGHGMLSAAVCGGIFASPSVSSILAAIRATAATHKNRNILLVVKNYTGDRLNFGMAAERANQEGITTEMVLVSDDCALPRTKGITGSRGVAGTVLVNKIAGAAAASGKSLHDVVSIANKASSRMGSLGIALNSVTIPGAEVTNVRLDDITIEIGLGIHGEAGMRQSPLLSANEMAAEMIKAIQNHGRIASNDEDNAGSVIPLFERGNDLCILVNNLGGLSNFEMSILARSCVQALESDEYGAKVSRLLVGSYMTSFDMQGASLTILNINDQQELADMIDSTTDAPAWLGLDVWQSPFDQRLSSRIIPEVKIDQAALAVTTRSMVNIENFSEMAKKCVRKASENLSEAETLLTQYDVIVGDGDCGITMKRGAMEILSQLENGKIPTDHPVPMFAAMADAVSLSMGGTSGVLIELMLRKISTTLSRYESISKIEITMAFKAGVEAVSFYGGANVGSRTMLDALVPASVELERTGNLQEMAAKARQGAENTANMALASAGRSNYLSSDTLMGTPDPGAVAGAIVMEAVASSL